MSVDRWPFPEPRNCVTFITAQVLARAEPILHAVHDENGEWQFIGSSDGTVLFHTDQKWPPKMDDHSMLRRLATKLETNVAPFRAS